MTCFSRILSLSEPVARMPIHGWKTLDVLLEGIFEAALPERDLVHVLCCCVYSAAVTAWRVGMAEQFLA